MPQRIPASADTRLGVSISTFVVNDEGRPDLDRNGRLIWGPRVVVESVMRRWLARRGTIPGDLSIGANIRKWLSAKLGDQPSDLDELRSELVLEALRDDRVSDIFVDVTLDSKNEKLSIRATIRTSTGTSFQFVAVIGRVTVDILYPVRAAA